MTIRKLARMLFVINGLQFLLGVGILIGLWNHLFEQSDFVLSLAFGIAILNQCYSTRGLAAVAGINISSTITNLFNVVFIAMGSALAIIVGQHMHHPLRDN